MKKAKTLIGIILVLVLTAGFTYQTDWFLLKSDGFQAEFPSEPVSQPQVVNSEIGDLKVNLFMYDASQGGTDSNLVYLVGFTEYPDSLVNSNMTELIPNFFRGSIDGAVKNVNGKILSETVIEINGYPGREVKIDFMEGQAIIMMRFYLVKNRLFMTEIATETSKVPNKSINRFFNSFKLI
jgi:hypothetical protein